MITLFLFACQVEFDEIEKFSPVMTHIEQTERQKDQERMWIEQCVSKKEAGL